MSDPIEKLTSLGDALEGAPMPLPASQIRARGDRIRRRRHAVVAGVSAAVVAAVAVPVVALTIGGDGKDKAGFTETPSPSVADPVPAAALSAENLMTEDDAVWYDPGADWTEGQTLAGDGQATVNPCQQESFDGLGATSVFQRDFTFTAQTDSSDPWPYLTEIVGEFDSPDDAQTAYDAVQGWYDDCTPSGSDRFTFGGFRPVDLPVDGEGSTTTATYGPVARRLDPYGDEGWFLDTGVVVSGDRVALVTALSHGQDYNFERTPAERMVPLAALRLVVGGGLEQPGTGGDRPTQIPAGFPLASGWPQGEPSSEYQLDGPSGDIRSLADAGYLEPCGSTAVDPGAVDRLTARLTLPGDGYARELELFPGDQEAVTYLAHLRALYGGCPTEGSTPTTTTVVTDGALGDESLVITRSGEGAFRTVVNVVRVGNGVVVDLASDEGSDPATLVTETQENLADVMAALNELEGAPGSDPSATDDPNAPARTTTIPDGFPLDLALGEPPVDDGETTVEGPGAETPGADPETACGVALAFPNAGSPDPDHELGYSVSSVEGHDGRTIHAYPTAQDAVDRMELLRSQVQGCTRDDGGDGLSERIWRTFASATGYESLTFGWYYAPTESQGATAGGLYTVVRVGNAILALDWSGEYSADVQRDRSSDQVELARLIGDRMSCDFSVAGC